MGDPETPCLTKRSPEDEEYIIITSSTLETTFQELATWKAGFVNGATVYDTTWIYANYTGTDNQMKIRNFIIDKYNNNGLKYVLLGGDTGVVPYRRFYVSSSEEDTPADMYYGHLDGSHNSDGDSRYGETNDNVDFYADVAVGRAPVETVAEAEAFVNKVITYEQADKPKRILLHQSRIEPGNSPDSRCLAWNCDDWVPADYVIDYLFEENGTVTKTDWRNAWAANPLVVVHMGRGTTNAHYINYEVGGTVIWYNSDVSSLTNMFWPVFMSTADSCGDFRENDCLAEEYVKDDCGAIAAITNAGDIQYFLMNACQYSGEFVESFSRALFSDGKEHLGDMLNKGKSYMIDPAQSNSTYLLCFYAFNLIGDPETPILTTRGTVTIDPLPPVVWGTVDINVSTTGCIDEVRFYIDGSLKYTDTTSPFSWSWDTTSYSEGSHTILVEGYCSGVFKDDGSVTVYVDNIPEPYVTITNPTQSQTVSGTVTCAASSNCDSVRWYIDGTYKAEDTSAPFQYIWDTTAYSDGTHTIRAEGYNGGVYQCEDSIPCNVDNSGSCLGTTILLLFILFGFTGIRRRHQ
jgi:hypothetical protein